MVCCVRKFRGCVWCKVLESVGIVCVGKCMGCVCKEV